MEITGSEKGRGYFYLGLSLSSIFVLFIIEIINCFHWDVTSPYFLIIYNSTIFALLIPTFLSLDLLKEQRLKITSLGLEYYVGKKLKFSEFWNNIKEIGIIPAPVSYAFNWGISVYIKAKNGNHISFWASLLFKNIDELKSVIKKMIFYALDNGNPEI